MLLLAAAALLAAGCGSMLRVSYGQAPNLLYFWLDNYLDFDDAQARSVRDALDDWFRWHRTTQLPDYAAELARLRAQAPDDVTAAQACTLWRELRSRADVAIERGLPAAATIALTLTPEQLQHLERRYAKVLDEVRRDYAQRDPAERHRAAVKRTLDRVEMFYGRFDDVQRRFVADKIAASPFDPERWIAERAMRQRDTLAALRRVVAERPSAVAVHATLRELAGTMLRSPRADYRDYSQRLLDYNCALAAEVHGIAKPAQRRHLADKLADWEADLRVLAGEAANGR